MGELRDRAHHKLFADNAPYAAPDIATSLADPLSFIAFVVVTRVKLPSGGGSPYTLVDLRVEQLLRGFSHQTELQAESRWVPPRSPDDAPLMFGGTRGTAFDYTEPKIGSQYLVGYPFFDVDRGTAHIFGAIDLSNRAQAQMISDVQRFLDIESAAGSSSFALYVAALSDPVPWIRDLSAQRLVQSGACNASSICQEAFLTLTQRLLRSKRPGERWEALRWTQPLALPMGERQAGPNGLPTMSNTAVRALLVSALLDPNLWIADEAFHQLELFDFFHDARPGECIVIFPHLRKSVRLTAGELEGISISGTVACTPGQASSDRE